MSTPPFSLISRASHKSWHRKTSLEKYNTIGSYFLGPRGENANIMKEKMSFLVDQVKNGRLQFGIEDPMFITEAMSSSQEFKDSVAELQIGLECLGTQLADHSVPFYSPRYAGHMNSDISMPAVLGYVIAQQYNQNNAAPEGGPFSSYIEWIVGQQLCAMIGYNSHFNLSGRSLDDIIGWGHIAADGSIANLESMWIARNLKYYPLALKQAMAPGAPLEFIQSTFMAHLCDGTSENFYLCDTWKLLNLTPTEVASIPTRLSDEYNISSEVLGRCLERYSIQTVGKQKLDAAFNITDPAQYMVSVANHYSWPKSCAITGIGRENLVTIDVDFNARMNTTTLETRLNELCTAKQAVYCVVAIEGTTEHGSVDPLKEIVAIRERMQKKGMSFMIHADAAWGGYFATKAWPVPFDSRDDYAFSIPLKLWTYEQLNSLRHADTVTVDPHKSGYIPYPAGGLCLRDGRHRFLTTWSSPYINVKPADDIAMGIYGIEGSKPGAAPIAACLSHEIIGLLDGGYADLLGTAMLTGVKMYSHWATMSLESSTLTVTPFNMLPIEIEDPDATPEAIKAQQEEIRDTIVNRRNDELERDSVAMKLVRKLGSDTMINAFACNFKVDGVVNADVVEANFLNARIYQRLSVQGVEDDLRDRPIIILRTEFAQEDYRTTLDKFKFRMQLSGPEDLVALSNVSMNPFPTVGQFLTTIMKAFRETAEDEIQNCLVRTQRRSSIHSFLVQGSNTLYLVYLPMFNIGNHKRQLIVTGTLSGDAMQKYTAAKDQDKNAVFTMHTKSTTLGDLKTLDQILTDAKFFGDIYVGLPQIYGSSPLLEDIEFFVTSVRVNQSLDRQSLHAYPSEMPFYLYGSSEEYHIDHVLRSAPNTQLSASGVTLRDVTPPLSDSKSYTLTFDKQIEWAMQPFTPHHPPSFFTPGSSFPVTIREEGYSTDTRISRGTITLSPNVGDIFVDYEHLNEEIAADVYIMVRQGSTKPDDEIKVDIDNISKQLVSLFDREKITWLDNVPHSLRLKCSVANEYSVTLGVPDASTIKDGAYFAVVSRFIGKQPTNTAALRFAQHKVWVTKFERGAPAQESE